MNHWQAAAPTAKKQDEVFTMPTEKPVYMGMDMASGPDRSEAINVSTIGSIEGDIIEAQTDNPLAKFNVQQAAINQVKTFSSIIVDVEKPETVKDAIDKKKITRDLRLKVQRREKAIDAGYVAQRKALKKDANAIYSDIKPVEDHLTTEIQKDIDHKEKLAEKARLEEVARVKKIDQNIGILTGHCEAALVDGMESEVIKLHLKNLMDTEIPKGIFQEKYQVACDLLTHAVESVRKNLAARIVFEEEEKKRKAELEELRKKGLINDQVAWFNKTFGFTGTMEGMEKGLESLERVDPQEFMVELLEEQKIQAQDILVAARAAQAEKDRIEAEKEYSLMWDEAHAMDATWIPTECEPEPEPEPEKVWTTTRIEPEPEPTPARGSSRKIDEAREIPGVKSFARRISAKPQPLDDAATIRTLFMGIKGAFYKPQIQNPAAYRVWVMMDEHMATMEKNVAEYLKTQGVKYEMPEV